MTRKISIVALVMISISATVVPAFLKAQPLHKTVVEGYVYDRNGNPLRGTILTVFPSEPRDNGRSVPGRTDENGHYSISDVIGGSFDIFYRDPLIGTVSVSRLSNAKDQNISKVLDQGPTPDAAFDALQGLELYAFLVEEDHMKDGEHDMPRLADARGATALLIDETMSQGGLKIRENVRNHLQLRLSFVSHLIDGLRAGK